MQKIKLFLLIIIITLTSCAQKNVEGIYYYDEDASSVSSNVFKLGLQASCSLFKKLEFKNGKCYIEIMDVNQELNYEIKNNVIYLKSQDPNNDETVIKIIDQKTLELAGCIYKKKK